MSNIRLLPEDDGSFVEWTTAWIGKLIKISMETGNLDIFLDFLEKADEEIKTSPKFANQVKNFLKDNELHKSSRDARIIMLSAHCPKRPEVPDPGHPH